MPLDAPGGDIPRNGDGSDARNVAAYQDPTGRWLARVLKRGEEPLGYERRFMPHFATCTTPEAHRRRQRGRWTSAQNAQRAGQRRRRTTSSPQQPYLGYTTPGRTTP